MKYDYECQDCGVLLVKTYSTAKPPKTGVCDFCQGKTKLIGSNTDDEQMKAIDDAEKSEA